MPKPEETGRTSSGNSISSMLLNIPQLYRLKPVLRQKNVTRPRTSINKASNPLINPSSLAKRKRYNFTLVCLHLIYWTLVCLHLIYWTLVCLHLIYWILVCLHLIYWTLVCLHLIYWTLVCLQLIYWTLVCLHLIYWTLVCLHLIYWTLVCLHLIYWTLVCLHLIYWTLVCLHLIYWTLVCLHLIYWTLVFFFMVVHMWPINLSWSPFQELVVALIKLQHILSTFLCQWYQQHFYCGRFFLTWDFQRWYYGMSEKIYGVQYARMLWISLGGRKPHLSSIVSKHLFADLQLVWHVPRHFLLTSITTLSRFSLRWHLKELLRICVSKARGLGNIRHVPNWELWHVGWAATGWFVYCRWRIYPLGMQ